MAKAKKTDKKVKKRVSSRDLITGFIVLIALVLALVVIIWLIMPLAGQRGVPRKLRFLQQSQVESSGAMGALGNRRIEAAKILKIIRLG